MRPEKIVSLHDAKARKDKERHRDLVLQCWDDAEHQDARTQREVATHVNQEAREKL